MRQASGHTCPDPETLGSFLEARLDAATRRSVAAHVGGCASCLAYLGGAASFIREKHASEPLTDEKPPPKESPY